MRLPEREGLGTAPFTGAAEGLPSSHMAPERAPFVKTGADVTFQYPLRPVIFTERIEAGFNGVCCRAGCPKPVGVWISRRFRYWVESQQVERLHGATPHGW